MGKRILTITLALLVFATLPDKPDRLKMSEPYRNHCGSKYSLR